MGRSELKTGQGGSQGLGDLSRLPMAAWGGHKGEKRARLVAALTSILSGFLSACLGPGSA